ncbi:MAG: aldose epimerase family protein [Saprospiraceae bacterium]
MEISKKIFGELNGQNEIFLFTISHESGAYIELSNYGATWISAVVPDKFGKLSDVLLGYKDFSGYLLDTNYMGSTIGRFANRIKNASFSIEDETYYLEKNDGENSNHSGSGGFHSKIFNYEIKETEIIFSLLSLDGEGGFPGNVNLKISYSFSHDLKVRIKYSATTDKTTFLNITNHAYFNLSYSENILHHQLYIPSEFILETNQNFIPTGNYLPVKSTVFDFTRFKQIGADINKPIDELLWNKGYNHCYPIHKNDKELTLSAILFDELSGRILKLYSTLPSVLIYTSGFLSSETQGKFGKKYNPSEGICLEVQYFPDSPNQPNFPSCLLHKDEIYDHCIEYHFGNS